MSERKACISVGEVGYLVVQVQANVACISHSTRPQDAENCHVSVMMTFFPIADAAELSKLLARVAEIHAENFAEAPKP